MILLGYGLKYILDRTSLMILRMCWISSNRRISKTIAIRTWNALYAWRRFLQNPKWTCFISCLLLRGNGLATSLQRIPTIHRLQYLRSLCTTLNLNISRSIESEIVTKNFLTVLTTSPWQRLCCRISFLTSLELLEALTALGDPWKLGFKGVLGVKCIFNDCWLRLWFHVWMSVC